MSLTIGQFGYPIHSSELASNFGNAQGLALSGLSYYTSLDGQSVLSVSNRDYYIDDCESHNEITRPVFALEKHITVIRNGPTMAPRLEMHAYEQEVLMPDGSVKSRSDINETAGITDDAVIHASFLGSRMHQSSNYANVDNFHNPIGVDAPSEFDTGNYWGDPDGHYNTNGTAFDRQDISMFYKANKELVSPGDSIKIPIDIARTEEDWKVGDDIIIEHEYADSFGSIRRATARLTIEILAADGWLPVDQFGNTFDPVEFPMTPWAGERGWGYYPAAGSALGWGQFWAETHIVAKLVSITGNFPQGNITDEDLYTVKLVQSPPIFEIKFPKFSYRYKYADGEYSVFAPWSEIAFIPGQFDYLPKKGYNLGMQNRLRSLNITNWVPKNIPKDVIQVDILYKESNSPNIYTVSSHKKKDPIEGNGPNNSGLNYWETSGSGGHGGYYRITSELIHKVVKSNQMLRPWDNVPKRALAQEVTANRLIFANYVQNYDLKDKENKEVKAHFIPSINSRDYSTGSETPYPGQPGKSLKSMRTYQLGVVYRDKYGRETPVMTSESGSIKIPKSSAKLQNRLSVKLENAPPNWAESYTFYIKETSNEYYNLSMDRWFDAEDGGVWLSFPSSERNKITERTNLILKKQHDTDVFTDFDTTYKILSLKNDAPTFIKTENKYWGSLPMMLPPPGWSDLGSWDSGMFYNTGLPLPNRMYLDIFAEYWDQSSFNELTSMSGAQIRVVQSVGQASAYNAATSDTTNKTHWYDIASITYIGSPPQTQQITTTDPTTLIETTQLVETPGQQEQLVRVSLEKAFGNDALFCEPDDNLSLARGLSIECRTKIVRDKSQFEGRFFVKILRDANVELNIVQPQLDTEDKYQVLFSRKLKYICAAHPGMQDWSKKLIDFQGRIHDTNNIPNFIPVGIVQRIEVPPQQNFKYGNTWGNGFSSGINETLYNVDNYSHPDPRLVSSLSYAHAGTGASYINPSGQVEEAPDGASMYASIYHRDKVMWPIGPGPAAVGAFDDAIWGDPTLPHFKNLKKWVAGDKLIWPSYRLADDPGVGGNPPLNTGVNIGDVVGPLGFTPTTNADLEFSLEGKQRDWPSFGPEKYSPYLKYETDTFDWAISADGPYANRVQNNITDHDIIELTGAPALNPGGISGSGIQHSGITTSHNENNYLQGANPTQIPAIWGNQEDFFRGTCTGCGSNEANTSYPGHHDYNGVATSYGGDHTWNAGTFEKLREDWYGLWLGRDGVHESWPFAKHSPQRWIIDKVGAAQGYSGNGIWANETTGTGYMDISFWGVGRADTLGLEARHHSAFGETMKQFNDNEHGFAQALRTPGTQFRFKYDPDQIVYTITNTKENDVYNYEAPQGAWGIEDDNGVISGGSGIGWNSPAPSMGTKAGPLTGGRAYISDLFSDAEQYDMT